MNPDDTKILMDIAADAATTRELVHELKQQLLGNGQPGKISQIETRLDAHQTYIDREKGGTAARAGLWAVGTSSIVSLLLKFGLKWWH
jgi:hypothetical protein